jgi:ParB family chromosome partitioning protein
MIRLLDLPAEVQRMVRERLLAMGHARAILAVEGAKAQVRLAEKAVREDLSVRQVEARAAGGGTKPKTRRRTPSKSPEVRDLEARLREALGTKVAVEPGRKPDTGRIVIQFYSQDDLDRILERLA